LEGTEQAPQAQDGSSLAGLMDPGPLPDMVLGKPDAPNTIVEYVSMTCPHCVQFHTTVLPELQTKYFDTGQVKLILREFPLDGLAVAAFMLARCSGPDRYYPMVSAFLSNSSGFTRPSGQRLMNASDALHARSAASRGTS